MGYAALPVILNRSRKAILLAHSRQFVPRELRREMSGAEVPPVGKNSQFARLILLTVRLS